MKASIVIIGDEILIGRVADTNTPAIASALTACGFDVCGVRTVGDSAQDIHGAVVCAMAEADIVISTGGLGPTRDDITKSVLTDIFGGELRHDASVAQNVERVFARRGLAMNDLTRTQAVVPTSCRVIQNTVGTAPVMWFEKDGKVMVAMPGVPAETRAMLPTVVDAVVERFHPCIERMRREFTVSGITESDLAERLAPFEDSMPDDFKLAYLPSPGRIVLRLEGPSLLFEGQAEALVAYLGDKLAGEGVLSPAELLLDALRKKGMTMATAESCTGGNIAHLLTSVAGCSDVFVGSVVSYSNDMKMRVLGVESSTLEKEGAVSRDTVLEMVRGVRKALGASCAVAASGIAGPGGATEGKPVGTVWIAASTPDAETARLYHFDGDRKAVIDRASATAINLLSTLLHEN